MGQLDGISNIIFQGDCLEKLKEMPDGIAHTCVTSPPYFGLRDYGVNGQIGLEKSPEAYVARLVEVFREVRRVLRDDGTLWLNLGDSYNSVGGGYSETGSRGATAAVGPKTQSAVLKGRNRDGHTGLKPKDLIGIPWRVAFALQADGWYLRQDIIWHKPNPMPESVTDRCTKAHEYLFLLSKSERYYFDAEAIKEQAITAGNPIKMADGWDTGVGGHGSYHRKGREKGKKTGYVQSATRNRRSVWTVTTKPYSGAHFATFPPDLIEPCIMAGAPVGGIVLDPFMGSGTTAAVAVKTGRQYVGTELNQEYIKLADQRIKQAEREIDHQGELFDTEPRYEVFDWDRILRESTNGTR